MNPHRTDLRHTARQRCKGTALLTVLFTLILALCTGFAVRPAHAEEPDATTNTDQAAKPGVSITVNSMTPVITPSSGYKLNLTVTNNTDADVDHGSIDALTNFTYNFISRTDLQEWAEGRGQIPLPDLLVTLHVPRIAAHKSVTVNSSLPASEEILKQFNSWGPRPLALDYRSDDGAQTSTLHSFVTRSQDGLQGERTPQLHMTMLMPLTAGDWSLDETTLKALRADRSAKTHASAIATLDGKSAEALRTKDQLTQRFPHVQALADPQVLATLQAPHMQALMQPADFDITRYSYADNANGYENAGVPLSSWAASSSVRTLRTVLNDGAAERPVYAMQGVGAWNTEALDTARMQGYDTVIATHDFDDQDDTAAHTGVYRVPTAHGDVTVMATHPMLSQLAAGQATSQEAQAETNTAGRLQRFIAQSAFYQMEQPYQNRCLLVSFGPDSSAANIAAFMGALQEASWLDLTDLETLRASEPYMSGDDAATVADTTTVDPAAYDTTTLDTTLTTLAHTRRDLQHFNTSVLLADGSMPGGPAAQTGDANNTKPGDGDANDADDASDNATHAEAQVEVEAKPFERNQQHQALECHAKRPGAGGERKGGGSPEPDRLLRRIAEHRNEHAEAEAANHIRPHGTPRVGAESVLHGENLPEEHMQAIEENLRGAPQHECHRQSHEIRAAVHVDAGEHGGERGDDHGGAEQQRQREGDDLVERLLGVVAVERTRDVRHQHGIEDAAGDEREDHLRNHRAGLVGIGCHTGGAYGGRQQNRANLAGDAARGRARGHDERIASYGRAHSSGSFLRWNWRHRPTMPSSTAMMMNTMPLLSLICSDEVIVVVWMPLSGTPS